MGIYDRPYFQDEPRGIQLRAPQSIVVTLVLINVAVFVVDLLSRDANGVGMLTRYGSLRADVFDRPWELWQLLTYGFLHSLRDIGHILFNMLVLWFLGRDIESIYGKKEFLQLYLSLVITSGLVWALGEYLQGEPAHAVGASGAVSGVVMLFILHFPHRTLLLWMVVPIPAWLLGVVWIGLDILGALDPQSERIAYSAHLAGALFGFLYFKTRWHLGRLIPSGRFLSKLRGPRLRVHGSDDGEQDLERKIDRILEKINRSGIDSLTSQERRELEKHSRRMQQKHR
jgi:membrane associated rhomboid family serine protease